jgi:hypothetical protein
MSLCRILEKSEMKKIPFYFITNTVVSKYKYMIRQRTCAGHREITSAYRILTVTSEKTTSVTYVWMNI